LKTTWALVCIVSFLAAQGAFAQQGASTDVYHVLFAKAVPGKAAALADFLKTQPSNGSMKGHSLLLRHQDGEDWDYALIEHEGTKATVSAATPAPPAAQRDLVEWHTDTFVSGPSGAAFARAMGIDQSAARTRGSVYVLSVYRAVPGHRDQLEKMVAAPTGPGDKVVGTVVMQHLEGGPWNYVSITRYNSWADFGASEASSVADTNKGSGGWFDMRLHAIFHTDTLANRIAP
jgi:hypothetical protein